MLLGPKAHVFVFRHSAVLISAGQVFCLVFSVVYLRVAEEFLVILWQVNVFLTKESNNELVTGAHLLQSLIKFSFKPSMLM